MIEGSEKNASADELARVAERWRVDGQGERYRRVRWRRRAARDPKLVARLLARHAPRARIVLDVPAGNGRLAPAIDASGARWCGIDVSPQMLAAVPGEQAGRCAVGRAERLPVRDGACDALVCCRLLHHVEDRAARRAVLAEFARVSRGPVLVSFWDRAAWPTWRRRLGLGRPGRDGRHATTRAELRADLEAAGLEWLEFAAPRRFLSAQTFAVARPRRARALAALGPP